MKKSTRSWSGVLPISLALEGNSFSCKHDCSFCPAQTVENGAEKTIARSYLSNEGTFLRGNMSDFKSFHQVIRRLLELESMNHYPDKLEIIILGGTWDCYPVKYRNEFIHDIYYACNIYLHFSKYFDKKFYHKTEEYLNQKPFQNKLPLPKDFFNDIRPRESLENEKYINTNLKGVRIIGIVLETRPDYITLPTLLEKRRLGCTRVQLGIQHTDNEVLLNNNRGHSFETSVKAIKFLKNNCFKVDAHLMNDLPFTTIEKDYEMVNTIFKTCQLDYVKIYPCLDLPFTQARKWKEQGIWEPYAESHYNDFVDFLAYTISIVPPWTRINRVQRDFPKASEKNKGLGYSSTQIETNLHQFVTIRLKEMKKSCYDIRSREIKNTNISDLHLEKTCLYVRQYKDDDATEYFISLEIPQNNSEMDDSILLGFIRLRILNECVNTQNHISTLRDTKVARIRELHVYGFIHKTEEHDSIQHKGIGKFLLEYAEYISYQNKCHSVAIISGVGVRKYYERHGYSMLSNDKGEFMIKQKLFPKYLLTLFGQQYFFLPFIRLQRNGLKKYVNAYGYRYRSFDIELFIILIVLIPFIFFVMIYKNDINIENEYMYILDRDSKMTMNWMGCC